MTNPAKSIRIGTMIQASARTLIGLPLATPPRCQAAASRFANKAILAART